jgi:hypothetical protein
VPRLSLVHTISGAGIVVDDPVVRAPEIGLRETRRCRVWTGGARLVLAAATEGPLARSRSSRTSARWTRPRAAEARAVAQARLPEAAAVSPKALGAGRSPPLYDHTSRRLRASLPEKKGTKWDGAGVPVSMHCSARARIVRSQKGGRPYTKLDKRSCRFAQA